jgi:hypothetical protein
MYRAIPPASDEMHESQISFWTNPVTKERVLDYKNCPAGTTIRTNQKVGGWTYTAHNSEEDTKAERERRRAQYEELKNRPSSNQASPARKSHRSEDDGDASEKRHEKILSLFTDLRRQCEQCHADVKFVVDLMILQQKNDAKKESDKEDAKKNMEE